MNKISGKPYYLNNELALSNNYCVYIIKINNDAFCYLNKHENAIEFADNLLKSLLAELIENNNSKYFSFQAVKNTENPNEYKIYKQSLGYIYNSKPQLVYNITIEKIFLGMSL